MYESPITIKTEEIARNIIDKQEEYILTQVQMCVDVDKDELLKALQYDRRQYEKGYMDRDAEIVRCKDCVHCKRFNDVWYLPKCDELLCTLHVEAYHTDENDYCSWGERRGDET